MKQIKDYIKRENSVVTGQSNLEHLYTFKDFPVFMGCSNETNSENDLTADMVWKIDPNSGIVQLSKLIPMEILYMDQHMDATGATWDRYNKALADFVIENHEGNILEIGGGSGKLANLIILKSENLKYTVVEPNPTFLESDRINIKRKFFTDEFKINDDTIKTITLSQVLEHVYDPRSFLKNLYNKLPEKGLFIFGYPNLEHLFSNKFTNAINFEHTILMTEIYVDFFLSEAGFEIIKKIPYENHSHFYSVRKNSSVKKNNIKLDSEKLYRKYKLMFNQFIDYHLKMVKEINDFVDKYNSSVFLFGAHIFSQYLISFGLKTEKIKFILDNSPIKIEKRLYGTNLLVKSPKILKEYSKPLVILKAGLYNKEIKDDIINNINSNVKFI